MPGDKKKRFRGKRGAGWVKDRLKYSDDPSDLYPLKRIEDQYPEKEEYPEEEEYPEKDSAGKDSGEEPEQIPETPAEGASESFPEMPSDGNTEFPSETPADSNPEMTSGMPVDGGPEIASGMPVEGGPEITSGMPVEGNPEMTSGMPVDGGPEITSGMPVEGDPEISSGTALREDPELLPETPVFKAPEKDPGIRLKDSYQEYSGRIRRFWTKDRIEVLRMVIRTVIAGFFAILFLMPIVLTITNSLMTNSEINANYGVIFRKNNGVRVFISNTVNLKFIPDIVSFGQYFKVLILSPDYLLKFWNSFIYVVPIVVFQLAIASLAAYGFARYRGRVREIIFFAYIILMLMPYQVTLVPNYLVSKWLNLLDTRWAIWLPGFFSPFAVYMLTKYMRRIPKSLYEAAEIDGAGEWEIFTKVCLPNCRGGIASIAILLFIDYWNMVEQPLILLSDDQLHPLSVFLSKINAGEISLAFAVAVIYMVLPMLVFLYGEDSLVEGIVYQGGIKE